MNPTSTQLRQAAVITLRLEKLQSKFNRLMSPYGIKDVSRAIAIRPRKRRVSAETKRKMSLAAKARWVEARRANGK